MDSGLRNWEECEYCAFYRFRSLLRSRFVFLSSRSLGEVDTISRYNVIATTCYNRGDVRAALCAATLANEVNTGCLGSDNPITIESGELVKRMEALLRMCVEKRGCEAEPGSRPEI